MGDAFYHALSSTDAGAYAKYAPTYIYHFDTLPGQNNTLSPKAGTRKRTKMLHIPQGWPLCLLIRANTDRGKSVTL
jgi:hypothetical protein